MEQRAISGRSPSAPPTGRPPGTAERPWWTRALAAFCAASLVFLVTRDLLLPHVRDVEVWFGFELRGALALATAPLHWALFAAGAWGFWHARPWVWPWASVYGFYVALSHLVWNQVSASGGGLGAGAVQFALFCIPAVLLLWARPPAVAGSR